MPMKAIAPTNRRIPSPNVANVLEGAREMIQRKTNGLAPVVAVGSRPGGKGKSTTSASLAAAAAQAGNAVCLIECDDYARQKIRLIGSDGRRKEPVKLERSSYALFMPEDYNITAAPYGIDWNDVYKRSPLNQELRERLKTERGWHNPNVFDLIPGVTALREIEGIYAVKQKDLAREMKRFIPNAQLAKSIAFLRKIYDLIVLDTPASLTTLTWNALMAATHIYMPVAVTTDGIDDFDETIETIDDVISMCEGLGLPVPTMIGYVANFFTDSKLGRAILQSYIGPHADPNTGMMVNAAIPYPMLGCLPSDPDTLDNAMAERMTVDTFAPFSPIGAAMADFSKTALKGCGLL